MTTPISQVSIDRVDMCEKWHAMRGEYHKLVESIPPAALRRRCADTRWSIAEILTHMIQSIELIPQEIEAVRKGKDFLNMPSVITASANFFLVKMRARKATARALKDNYDRVFENAMVAWEGVAEDEWAKGANFFGEGYRTLADNHAIGITHFQEHADQIRKALTNVERR